MSKGITIHHCHVFPKGLRPEGTIAELLRIMDAVHIESAVVFSPFAHQLKEEAPTRNRWLAGEIQNNSRLIGFGTIDLTQTDLEDQVQEIFDLGFKGIKLHPAAQKVSIVSPECRRVYEISQRLGLFLTFHTGIHWHKIRDYHPLLFDEIAEDFPELRMSLEHLGGYHFLTDALAVITNNSRRDGDRRVSHLYGGLTSVFHPEKDRYWYFTVEKLKEIVHQVGAHQLIFGLDFPFKREAELRHSLHIIDQLGLSPEEKQQVLGGNVRKVLGM